MNTKSALVTLSSLVLGFASGMAVGYYVSKNRFQELADKEIESVRKVYEKHFKKDAQEESAPKSNRPKPAPLKDQEAYKNYAEQYKGSDKEVIAPIPKKSIQSPPKVVKKTNTTPYVISPEQYNESEYEADTLIYYSDKVLSDSDGNIIHNVNEVIGPEALSTFGRYLDDTVYVRDDNKKIDYEIIWESRTYKAVNNLAGDKVPLDEDDSE